MSDFFSLPVVKLDFILIFVVNVDDIYSSTSNKTEFISIEPLPEDDGFVDFDSLELLLRFQTPDLENKLVGINFSLEGNDVLLRMHNGGFSLVWLFSGLEVVQGFKGDQIALTVSAGFLDTDVFIRFEGKNTEFEVSVVESETSEVCGLTVVKRLSLHKHTIVVFLLN
jgi:hypothetical protein